MPNPALPIGTTQSEAEVLAATEAALAAGNDPFGDNDDDDTPAADLADDTPADDGGENSAAAALLADAAPELTAEQQEAIAGDDDAQPGAAAATAVADDTPQDEPEAPRYRVDSPEAMAAARSELREKKAKAFKDYTDGVIEADEFSRIDSEVSDALEALTVQRALHTANEQAQAATQTTVLNGIMAAAKAAGHLDYRTDATAAAQFDAAMAMIQADGKQRTYAQLANAAHKAVLAARGIVVKDGATAAPAAAKPRENGKGPLTLRELPAASVPNSGGGWQDKLAGLTGQQYEDAYNALTPAQQAALLD